MQTKRIIQVGGTVRSGTTMVGLVLANEEKAIGLGEIYHLFYPRKETHFAKIEELRKDIRWTNILDGGPANLYRTVFENFPEIDIIVDSSKDPFWFRETAAGAKGMYPIKRVVTFKSPDELSKSFQKRGLPNWRKVYLNYYRRFFTIFPETPTIYFNEFLKNEEYSRKVCELMDVAYSKERMEYWNREQPNFFGSDTVNKKVLDKNSLSSVQDDNWEADKDVKKTFFNLQQREIGNRLSDTVIKAIRYNKLEIFGLYLKDYYFKHKRQ